MKSFIQQICNGLHTLYTNYKYVINVNYVRGNGRGYVLVVLYINYITETKQVNRQFFPVFFNFMFLE